MAPGKVKRSRAAEMSPTVTSDNSPESSFSLSSVGEGPSNGAGAFADTATTPAAPPSTAPVGGMMKISSKRYITILPGLLPFRRSRGQLYAGSKSDNELHLPHRKGVLEEHCDFQLRRNEQRQTVLRITVNRRSAFVIVGTGIASEGNPLEVVIPELHSFDIILQTSPVPAPTRQTVIQFLPVHSVENIYEGDNTRAFLTFHTYSNSTEDSAGSDLPSHCFASAIKIKRESQTSSADAATSRHHRDLLRGIENTRHTSPRPAATVHYPVELEYCEPLSGHATRRANKRADPISYPFSSTCPARKCSGNTRAPLTGDIYSDFPSAGGADVYPALWVQGRRTTLSINVKNLYLSSADLDEAVLLFAQLNGLNTRPFQTPHAVRKVQTEDRYASRDVLIADKAWKSGGRGPKGGWDACEADLYSLAVVVLDMLSAGGRNEQGERVYTDLKAFNDEKSGSAAALFQVISDGLHVVYGGATVNGIYEAAIDVVAGLFKISSGASVFNLHDIKTSRWWSLAHKLLLSPPPAEHDEPTAEVEPVVAAANTEPRLQGPGDRHSLIHDSIPEQQHTPDDRNERPVADDTTGQGAIVPASIDTTLTPQVEDAVPHANPASAIIDSPTPAEGGVGTSDLGTTMDDNGDLLDQPDPVAPVHGHRRGVSKVDEPEVQPPKRINLEGKAVAVDPGARRLEGSTGVEPGGSAS